MKQLITSFLCMISLPLLFLAAACEAKKERTIATGKALQLDIRSRNNATFQQTLITIATSDSVMAYRDEKNHWTIVNCPASLDIITTELRKVRSENAILKMQLDQCRLANNRQVELLKTK